MGRTKEPSATRRRMLVSIAASGAVLAGAQAAPGLAEAHPLLATRGKRPLFVFRFSTRGHSSCNACKNHHKYVVASHSASLDARRAHPGCNCPIVRQVVTKSQFRRWFPSGEGVIDLRVAG